MKRFNFLLATILMLGIGVAAVAAMPTEKKVVKVEVSSTDASVSPALVSVEFNFYYVASPTGESIMERPPTVIGETLDAYKISIIKPPVINNEDFLPSIRRLSCNSLVAASDRHI